MMGFEMKIPTELGEMIELLDEEELKRLLSAIFFHQQCSGMFFDEGNETVFLQSCSNLIDQWNKHRLSFENMRFQLAVKIETICKTEMRTVLFNMALKAYQGVPATELVQTVFEEENWDEDAIEEIK